MKPKDRSQQCADWLKAYLAGKTLPCEEVRKAAFAEGFTKQELRIARAMLGVIPGMITTWELPEDDE